MIGLDLLAAHLVGDFILQTDAVAKRKLHCAWTRAWHCYLYCVPFAFVALAHGVGTMRSGDWRWPVFAVVLYVSHFIIDSRRWASGEKWAAKPIVVNQTLHIVTLAILGRILL